MKIKEILKNVDKSNSNQDYIDLNDISNELNMNIELPYVNRQDCQIKCYWVACHLCTDTFVGLRVYFLNDEQIAISYQSARKSDENFEWINQNAVEITKKYLMSLAIEDDNYDSISFVDMDEDLSSGYTVSFASELLDENVQYNNKNYKVVRRGDGFLSDTIFIQHLDEEIIEVNLKSVTIPWRKSSN